MLSLPSGRVVDLSSDRAKYHALRLPAGSAPHASCNHPQLHAVVDVVYRHADGDGVYHPRWTEHDYVFSGHTLATIRQAADWSAADKDALLRWADSAQQRRIIETARRRLREDQHYLSTKTNAAPRHLYSLLLQRLSALPLARASARQWRATIDNLQRSGVREEEIVWSGLRRFMRGQADTTLLDKAQILAAIDFRSIRLELSTEQRWGMDGNLCFEEVAQRMPHQVVYRAALGLDASCHCILRYVDGRYNYRVGVVKTLADGHPMALNKDWFVLDSYGRSVPCDERHGPFYRNSESAMRAASDHARATYGIHRGVRFHTRFDHLTLAGGSDYREWIVSLPDHQRLFFGAHHIDHNVLLHIRSSTRVDTKGRRLLFIEELQSDWHQSGQRLGYDTDAWGSVANAPFKKEWVALGVKLMLIRASQNGYDGIAWPSGEIQEMRYASALQPIKRHYDREIPQALDRLGRPFQCAVGSSRIVTLDPWLNVNRTRDKWAVADDKGRFRTRPRYRSHSEAMAVLARHARRIELEVPSLLINPALHRQLTSQGLPLFGTSLDP